MKDLEILDDLVVGRVEPHIYAFKTNTVPNYLKVGDTYRPVSIRLKEWETKYPKLEKQFEDTAKVTEDVFFRDYAVHKYLEYDLRKKRLLPNTFEDVYYSNEFFEETVADEVAAAIEDIKSDYHTSGNKYQFYSVATQLPSHQKYPSAGYWQLRPNQAETVKAFLAAKNNGRTNLLMYAVMRFGKSFTSMCCAKEMGARVVVIVSAKADVMDEWRKTIECAENFRNDYEFLTSKDLKKNDKIISTILSKKDGANRVALFLTLQDLQGKAIKDKHKEVFGEQIDLLLVDETHFGARSEKYGEVLKKDAKFTGEDEYVDIDKAEKQVKTLNAQITIHLSGTPYRILMGSEFKKEDIIAFYQFSDIVDAQKKWDEDHLFIDETKEWDNPYYGFPQMIRFAFNPNESSRRKLNELKGRGETYTLSALFEPESIEKSEDNSHKKFKNEREILDLLTVIDGSQEDENLLGFLDYDKIKQGNMCRHIVIVLPYCASCDALESLIKANEKNFKNLNKYEIMNISGVDEKIYKTPQDIKNRIKELEKTGKKTITLTVNRMLTGSTIPEWDTMIYLKDTSSPQEYDQAIFRLQNQYIKEYKDSEGNIIKFNMKPQTLLVDFDINRMFAMQEERSKIYNANINVGGNTELRRRMEKELAISPIVCLNSDKIEIVEATDILEAISNYNRNKGITDEANETPVDLSILDNPLLKETIDKENELGSNKGLAVPATKGPKDDDNENGDINVPSPGTDSGNAENKPSDATTPSNDDKNEKNEKSLTKKIKSYYTRILLFAFITNDKVISLSDIILSLDKEDNARIAKNLGLSKQVLTELCKMNPFVLNQLDYKIQDLNGLSLATDISAAEKADIAVSKFGKLGEATVITPAKICDEMVNLIPDDCYLSLGEKNKILDIAGTAGEFAVAIHKKMTALGIDNNIIKDSIYTIAKSSICYELTRKLYSMLGLNIDNIATFYATDMLEIKQSDNAIDYDRLKALLTQQKAFCEISLTDIINEGEDKVKFEAIVGNPPYQQDVGVKKDNYGIPIYNLFVCLSITMMPKYISMITPSRWFTGGRGLEQYRNKMLKDRRIKKLVDFPDSKDCFPAVDISGGISYFLWDANYSGKCEFVNYHNNIRSEMLRDLDQYQVFTRYNSAIKIIDKIKHKSTSFLSSIVSQQTPFGFVTTFRGEKDPFKDSISLLTSGGVTFVSKDQVLRGKEMLPKYKVIFSKATCEHAGVPDKNGRFRVISFNSILAPFEICSQSYLVGGSFDKKEEAINFQKYIKTCFSRFLLLQAISSQDLSRDKFMFVPIQDFTEQSDIDWSKSVAEIDQQLYKKYNLSNEEIDFIESMIKPME